MERWHGKIEMVFFRSEEMDALSGYVAVAHEASSLFSGVGPKPCVY
jgi:hypothetical protein